MMTATTTTTPSRLERLLAFIEQDAGNLALRTDAIREACDAGRWEVARSLIDTGLQAHPADPGLLALSGFAHLQALRYIDAERAFRDALGQGLESASVHYNLAFALFMQERREEAFALLSVPGIAEEVPLALLLRSRCLHHLARIEEAIAACQVFLLLAPEDPEANGLMGLLLYEQHQSFTAQRHIDLALQHDPKQLDAMLARACVQSEAQDYETARISFGALLEAHPTCGRGWFGLGQIELLHMQLDAAERAIEIASTHMPEHIGTWHVLGWIHIMRGNVLAAQLAFQRALAVDRTFGESHGGLAVIAALQGQELNARTSIKRALRLDPQSMSAQYAQMLLLQSHGATEEARGVLEAVLSRPLSGSDMQYRDLVAAHVKYLETTAMQRSAPQQRH